MAQPLPLSRDKASLTSQPKKRRRLSRSQIGFLFILPWLIGFLVFKLYPFASSLFYSFTDYNLHKGISETGLFNYKHVFTDPRILKR